METWSFKTTAESARASPYVNSSSPYPWGSHRIAVFTSFSSDVNNYDVKSDQICEWLVQYSMGKGVLSFTYIL